MNERIRELFETHTVPNFSVGDNLNLAKKNNGEYIDPTLEDHWQTFQEAAELIVRECAGIVNSLEQYEGQGDCATAEYIKERFGVQE